MSTATIIISDEVTPGQTHFRVEFTGKKNSHIETLVTALIGAAERIAENRGQLNPLYTATTSCVLSEDENGPRK